MTKLLVYLSCLLFTLKASCLSLGSNPINQSLALNSSPPIQDEVFLALQNDAKELSLKNPYELSCFINIAKAFYIPYNVALKSLKNFKRRLSNLYTNELNQNNVVARYLKLLSILTTDGVSENQKQLFIKTYLEDDAVYNLYNQKSFEPILRVIKKDSTCQLAIKYNKKTLP
jgi:hypothetical protein